MNDQAAMTAVNAVLDGWLNLEWTAVEALRKIAQISAATRTEHEAAK